MNHIPETERNVFRFAIGDRIVFADPMRARRRMTAALDGDPQQWLAQYRSDNPQARSDAVERLVPATLETFDLPPFDPATGEGTLEDDALGVLRVFLEWMAAKKKSTGNSPTSSPALAGASSSAAPSTTPASSVFGSTSDGCDCSGPTP